MTSKKIRNALMATALAPILVGTFSKDVALLKIATKPPKTRLS